jgi:DNA polymerase-3 subunit beta
MKLSIEREELLRGLGRVQAIVERRGTMPILANVLIEARDDGLTLAATDLEVAVVARHPAKVKTAGSVTLGAKKLYEITRELEHAEVTLVADDARVTLTCGPAKFNLLSTSPEEYPSVPGAENASFAQLDTGLVAELIDHTLYATSSDETRYNLNGVFVESADGKRVRFVATDGYRISLIERAVPNPITFLSKGIIVPRKGIAEIRKLCDEGDGTLEIGAADGFLHVRRPDLLLTTRLIDGEFPNYRQILPKGHRVRLLVEREKLLHAVRRIALMAHERSRGFRFVLADGQLDLSASNPDLGEARELLPVEYQGERFETAFNAKYLLDVLGAMTAKEVAIELSEELSPVQIRPADDADESAVIMPMRL